MKKIILIFALAFVAVLTGCFGGNDYVVRIGSEKISRGEYMVYLMEQKKSFEEQGGADIWEADFDGVSAEEVAKQNAVNTILMVKTAVKEAETLNISIADEDKDSIEEQTNSIISEFTPEELSFLELDRDKVYSIMEDVALQQKVYDYVTGSYVVNEDEFQEYMTRYYEDNKSLFTEYLIKEIFVQADNGSDTTNSDKIHSYFDKISRGEDFDKVLAEASPGSSSDAFVLDPSLYTEDTLNKIYALKKGQCTLVEDTDGYHIFKIEDIRNTDVGNIEAELKETYINEKKQEVYQSQNESWAGDTQIIKNEAVWNDIHI